MKKSISSFWELSSRWIKIKRGSTFRARTTAWPPYMTYSRFWPRIMIWSSSNWSSSTFFTNAGSTNWLMTFSKAKLIFQTEFLSFSYLTINRDQAHAKSVCNNSSRMHMHKIHLPVFPSNATIGFVKIALRIIFWPKSSKREMSLFSWIAPKKTVHCLWPGLSSIATQAEPSSKTTTINFSFSR